MGVTVERASLGAGDRRQTLGSGLEDAVSHELVDRRVIEPEDLGGDLVRVLAVAWGGRRRGRVQVFGAVAVAFDEQRLPARLLDDLDEPVGMEVRVGQEVERRCDHRRGNPG